MQDENIISNLENEWQLIAYLTNKNQSNTEQKQVETGLREELDHIHGLAHENEEDLKELLEDVSEIKQKLAEINRKVSDTDTARSEPTTSSKKEKIQCTICGERYDYKIGAASHLRGVHDKTGEGVTDEYTKTVSVDSPQEVETETVETEGEFSCPVVGCDETFERFVYRSMHLANHAPLTAATVIKESDRGEEIYNQLTSVARESFITELDNTLRKEGVSFEETGETEDSETGQDLFTCPECGESYTTVQAISNHITQAEDHSNPSELFKEGSKYVCIHCGADIDSKGYLSTHLNKKHGSSIVREYLKHEQKPDESDHDDLFDEEGNLKALEGKRKRIDNQSKEQIEEQVYGFLQEEQVAKTQNSIMRELYNTEPDSESPEYSKLYEVLTGSDKIYSNGKLGVRNRYYTDEAMLDQARRDHVKDKVESEIGEQRWKLFVRAINSLLPSKGETREITFYDFSGEYMGDDDVPAEKMWKMFATPETRVLRDALKEISSGSLEFDLKEPEGVPKGPSAYQDMDVIKQWTVEVTRT